MFEIEGFILAGGASSRMGIDKAHLRLGGLTLVERAAAALGAVAGKISVVSSKRDAGVWGLPVVPDVHAGRGALGGLHAALLDSRAPWAAVVSCDLPFVTGELFVKLSSFLSDDLDAVAPLQADGRIQPLCAIYAPARCLAVAEDFLRSGELRPRELLRRVRARLVAFEELSGLPGASRFFSNVNTPEDYALALNDAENFNPAD
ncbi:MAG TPA: molybdenum cofactor guanylyltransferase [Pyrinomonadaceae bacterium]|nr:molybdenum cofactor guanylyltransferase [Pyrinomonadaceae bacterium]